MSAGAYTAIAECGHQFKYETWSCPEEAFYLNDARKPGAGQFGLDKEGERNNHLILIDDNSNSNSNNNNKKIFKTSRSLKFKALRKGGNKRPRVRNQDDGDDNVNGNVNAGNNRNNNNNNQIRRRKARTRTAKLHDADNDADIALIDASDDDLVKRLPDWRGIRRPTTREAAFVHAIMSAGITHTLTKNCSSGDFPDCVCDSRLTRRQLGWEWGGCSDNYHFGSQVAKQFLDTVESGADSKSLANLHNNEAGRIVSL